MRVNITEIDTRPINHTLAVSSSPGITELSRLLGPTPPPPLPGLVLGMGSLGVMSP